MPVKMIVPADVPIAIGTRCSVAKPSREKISRSTGTVVKPPPMPSSPARNPMNAPSARKTGNSAKFIRPASSLTAFHSAGVTGVIDSRLPLRSVTIVDSAGVARISASGTRRVLRTSLTSTFHQRGSSRVDLGS